MSSKARNPDPHEFEQIMRLYQSGQLEHALSSARDLTDRYPESPPVRNAMGVIEARLGNLGEALSQYDEAIRLKAEFPEAYNNRGNTLNRMGQHDEAIASFRKAIEQRPDYAQAHNGLGNALQDAGRLDEALTQYHKAVSIAPDYAEAHNNMGTLLREIGKTEQSLVSLKRALSINPNFPQAYHNLGNSLRALGRHDEAIGQFQQAIQLNSQYAEAYHSLGNALNDQGWHREAIQSLSRAIDLSPERASAHSDMGNTLSDANRHAEALECYRRAISLDPDFAEAYCNLGNSLSECGEHAEAIENFERALELKPSLAEAYNNLVRAKTFVESDPQLESMLERYARDDISEHERMHLAFALGKAYDDMARTQEAFGYLAEGNRLRKKSLKYNIDQDRRLFEIIKRIFAEDIAVTPAGDTSARQPIFIVGMPRSGTTLTEQILASHSRVHGAGELQTLGLLSSRVISQMLARKAQTIPAEVLAQIRDAYMAEIAEIDCNEPFVTDKMPGNFQWIGVILATMPEAKIINLNRDPAACCWSMFRIQFVGNGYTNDLKDLGEYYHLYRDLMSYWRDRFPGRVYDLDYEALTRNQEEETRKLLEYCELPFEEACLRFYESERAVRTPSNRQVRQKMYTGSSESWRRYEAHLKPLLDILNRPD
jgi:tetratricopeptide (TPR) repeat protein